MPGTPYQETKKRAEGYVLSSGLDATVSRPSVIFGDPKGKGEGHVRMSPVHVDDVSQAFVTALANDTTIGKTCALGGPEALSWSDMIGRVAKVVESDKWVLPVPVGLMKIGATLFDWLPFFPVTRDQLTMLAEGNTADPSIIESLIGRPVPHLRPTSFPTSCAERVSAPANSPHSGQRRNLRVNNVPQASMVNARDLFEVAGGDPTQYLPAYFTSAR